MSDHQARSAGFATLAIHAGHQPGCPTTGFAFLDQAVLTGSAAPSDGADSPRHAGMILEERVAALEGGTAAVAVASGQAARLLALQTILGRDGEVVVCDPGMDVSSGRLDRVWDRFGWTVRFAESDDPGRVAAALSERTRAILVHAISQQTGAVTDIAGVAAVARDARVPLVVDNTVATPYLVRPLEHGADIVLHSAAGLLAGRGSAAGGLIVDGGTFDWLQDARYPALSQPCGGRDDLVLGETFGNFAFSVACRMSGVRDLGLALSPLDAASLLAGLETLPLRMQRHCENALAVADHLVRHPAVHWVRYAGLPSDPGHALATRYAPLGAGAGFTFGVAGGIEAGANLMGRLKLFSAVPGLGDARSRAIHPASMERRGRAGGDIRHEAGADVVHVTIGLEDKADIIADLDQALAV